MTIELASFRFREQYHWHRCPKCKRVKREPNTVCAKQMDHTFICISCANDVWVRFGDTLLDAYFDQWQMHRFKEMAPNKHAEELDEKESKEKEIQLAQAKQISETLRRVEQSKTPAELEHERKQLRDEHDRLMDEADRLTYDEVVAEIEKEEKEKL